MRGEDCYAALGLKPGARRAEVDEAYRRLIKRYHPDRTGGDCSRAAEINSAYSQLRRDGGELGPRRRSVPVPVAEPHRPRGSGRGAAIVLVFAMLATVGAIAAMDDRRPGSRSGAEALPLRWADSAIAGTGGARPLADFDEPLHTKVIDQAIADAVRLHRDGDAALTTAFSRSCQNSLRERPGLAWFDACAAFDEATVILNRDDDLADSGPFGSLKISSRQLAAARVMSGDGFEAEARLREIRSRVELTILPRLEDAPTVEQL